MEVNKIYLGKNLDVLKTFPDNSIDSVVTDPPYGLGKEPNVYEVMKSWVETGYHEIKGKGFMGKEWDSFVPQPIFWKEVYRVLKPGGFVLSFAGTRTYDWMVMAIRFAGFEVRDMIGWLYGQGFPKSLDVEKAINKIDGIKFSSKPASGVGFMKPISEDWHVTKNQLSQEEESSERAKQWQGFGTALKPAIEPIVLARKPVEGTVAENMLKYGVGGLNIDGCRVGTNPEIDDKRLGGNGTFKTDKAAKNVYEGGCSGDDIQSSTLGRWPANVIHDGSDEVVSLFPNEGIESAARFFYTSKTSQSERNAGLYGFEEESIGKLQGGRKEGSAGSVMPSDGRINPYAGAGAKKRNIHPTVKPLDLMRYLCRLITPPNGIVLDPYIGSGTTAVAAKLEGFQYIGIEMEADYCKIAEARVANCDQDYNTIDDLLSQPGVVEVPTIFDFI